MKVNSGVEWAAHACTLLAALPPGWTLSAEALANYHDVPAAYMAKQMQALSKAGLIQSQRGASGGYSLARAPTTISLWDVMSAIEGTRPAFRCSEIRQNGPCGASPKECKVPCGIAASFFAAEEAYRGSLRAVTIADMLQESVVQGSPDKTSKIKKWVQQNVG